MKIRAISLLRLLFQLALLCLLFVACNHLAAARHWLIPGSVIGLGILLLLLWSRILPERAVSDGAGWLLGELLLFFIPPVISIIKYWSLIRADALTVAATVVVGTMLVLAGTAWMVERMFNLEKRLHTRQLSRGG